MIAVLRGTYRESNGTSSPSAPPPPPPPPPPAQLHLLPSLRPPSVAAEGRVQSRGGAQAAAASLPCVSFVLGVITCFPSSTASLSASSDPGATAAATVAAAAAAAAAAADDDDAVADQAEVQGRAPSAAVPQLELPSSYHKPPTRASSAAPASLQGPSRTDAPDSLPPGIAALLAGADPSPALTTMLMPKTIDVRISQQLHAPPCPPLCPPPPPPPSSPQQRKNRDGESLRRRTEKGGDSFWQGEQLIQTCRQMDRAIYRQRGAETDRQIAGGGKVETHRRTGAHTHTHTHSLGQDSSLHHPPPLPPYHHRHHHHSSSTWLAAAPAAVEDTTSVLLRHRETSEPGSRRRSRPRRSRSSAPTWQRTLLRPSSPPAAAASASLRTPAPGPSRSVRRSRGLLPRNREPFIGGALCRLLPLPLPLSLPSSPSHLVPSCSMIQKVLHLLSVLLFPHLAFPISFPALTSSSGAVNVALRSLQRRLQVQRTLGTPLLYSLGNRILQRSPWLRQLRKRSRRRRRSHRGHRSRGCGCPWRAACWSSSASSWATAATALPGRLVSAALPAPFSHHHQQQQSSSSSSSSSSPPPPPPPPQSPSSSYQNYHHHHHHHLCHHRHHHNHHHHHHHHVLPSLLHLSHDISWGNAAIPVDCFCTFRMKTTELISPCMLSLSFLVPLASGVLAAPPGTPAKRSELLRMVRASALVLHARALADADSAALVATSALVKSLEADAAQ